MNNLPPELYDEIIDRMNESKGSKYKRYNTRLAQYAPISRMWKDSVERRTFKELKVDSDELVDFENKFRGANVFRRQALQRLHVHFTLPNPPNLDGCCDVTRVPDRNVDSWVFSITVRKLFIILADFEKRLERPSPMSLVFCDANRMSHQFNKHGGYGVYRFRCKNHSRTAVREARTTSGKYELHPLPMPTLVGVNDFAFRCNYLLEKLRPTWIPIVMRHLSRVENVKIVEDDNYEIGRILRMQHRQEIYQNLRSLPRDSLVRFVFKFVHTELKSDESSPHKLSAPGMWREETWSRIVQHLAEYPHLQTVQFLGQIVVCPEFFLNFTEQTGVCFPSLEELYLEFALETADGNWFYVRDEEAFAKAKTNPEYEEFWWEVEEDIRMGLDSDEDMEVFEDSPRREQVRRTNRFRSLPNSEVFRPFLYDASQAFKRLQKLRKFVMVMPERNGIEYPFLDRRFELWWLKSGVERSIHGPFPSHSFPRVPQEDAYLHCDRLYWRTGDWEPWAQIQNAWAEAVGFEAKVFHMRTNMGDHAG